MDGTWTAPDPTPTTPPFPQLTPRQIRLGLASIGITDAQVEALISALPDAEAALINWRYANSYDRDHPLVIAMIPAFGITPVQVDDLWRWASEL